MYYSGVSEITLKNWYKRIMFNDMKLFLFTSCKKNKRLQNTMHGRTHQNTEYTQKGRYLKILTEVMLMRLLNFNFLCLYTQKFFNDTNIFKSGKKNTIQKD